MMIYWGHGVPILSGKSVYGANYICAQIHPDEGIKNKSMLVICIYEVTANIYKFQEIRLDIHVVPIQLSTTTGSSENGYYMI